VLFGSDGHRGVLGAGVTRDTICRIVLGTAEFVRGHYPERSQASIPIGYDTRFLSRQFAEYAARLLAQEGFVPHLAHRPCPSPYLAFAVRQMDAPVGLVFTASHNPALYHGLKLKGAHGGSMLPSDVDLIEEQASELDPKRVTEALIERRSDTKYREFNIDREYARAIEEAADYTGGKEITLVVDFMHGAGIGVYYDQLHKQIGINTALRANADPLFGGNRPEPLPANLDELAHRVGYDGQKSIGLAFDGDGDRLAVVDETGQFLSSHEIFCILLEHLVSMRKAEGVVITTVSFSGLVEQVALAHGLVNYEVPVGFKHVSMGMLQMQAIMGGEESGGTGFGHYLPERDALLMALRLLDARHRAGTSLHEMVANLYSRYGRPVFISRNIPLPSDGKRSEYATQLRALADLDSLAGDEVVSLNHRDGMKLKTKHGWVLVRLSGTEPLLRLYAEARSEDQAAAYADEVQQYLGLA